MSMAALRWARSVRGISSTQKLVLLLLADTANDAGEAWPGIPVLMADAGLSERAVQQALRDLSASRRIAVTAGGGRHRTSLYRLLLCSPETPQDVPPTPQDVRGKGGTETPHVVPETPHVVPETPQQVRETPQQVHPNPQEPPITPKEPPKGTREKPATGGASVPLPPWLDPVAWAEWCEYRKGRKWTEQAAKLSITNLGRFRAAGDDPAEVIRQSIANGWTGLFAQKNKPAAQRGGSRSDANRAELGEMMQRFYGDPPDDHPPPFDLEHEP